MEDFQAGLNSSSNRCAIRGSRIRPQLSDFEQELIGRSAHAQRPSFVWPPAWYDCDVL